MKPKLVTIRWTDHYDHDDTWVEPEKPDRLKPALVESVGWIISENEEVIQLAGDRPLDEGDSGYGRVTHILTANIYYRSDRDKKKRRPKAAPAIPVDTA
jgi:hypothetical protein